MERRASGGDSGSGRHTLAQRGSLDRGRRRGSQLVTRWSARICAVHAKDLLLSRPVSDVSHDAARGSSTMGFLDSASATGTVLACMLTLSLVDGLKCLTCQGQNVYECIMSAVITLCSKGEECRFRMLHRRYFYTRWEAWFEAGCAARSECRQEDSFSAHFCCRISYCNYLPVGK
ncbi:uncharacterized protein LOC131948727 [Physella acuta]|uniref:uncharacterized protein LOC131948727 n=1 Tax=Physella acuta TaxID=109671 RepID=UPI0027DB1B50|nr:uncharacterized protein LOC131948727 [Physella acuta]